MRIHASLAGQVQECSRSGEACGPSDAWLGKYGFGVAEQYFVGHLMRASVSFHYSRFPHVQSPMWLTCGISDSGVCVFFF